MNRRHQETMRLPFPDGHEGEAGQLGARLPPDGKTLMAKEDMPSYRAAQGEEFDDYTYWVGDDPLTRAAFSTSARQVRGPSGERLGAALAYQEITDLMRAMQVKDEFVSSVSHELRTPLTSVLGYLELLARERAPARRRGRAGRRSSSATPPGCRRCCPTCSRSARSARPASSCSAPTSTWSRSCARRPRRRGCSRTRAAWRSSVDVPDRPAGAGRRAADPAGAGQPALQRREVQPPGRLGHRRACARWPTAIVLEVSDTGMGIAADEIDQVFGRFFRGGEALEQHIPGTGLGLNIVSSIVAAHGGDGDAGERARPGHARSGSPCRRCPGRRPRRTAGRPSVELAEALALEQHRQAAVPEREPGAGDHRQVEVLGARRRRPRRASGGPRRRARSSTRVAHLVGVSTTGSAGFSSSASTSGSSGAVGAVVRRLPRRHDALAARGRRRSGRGRPRAGSRCCAARSPGRRATSSTNGGIGATPGEGAVGDLRPGCPRRRSGRPRP